MDRGAVKHEADPPNTKSSWPDEVRPWPHLGDGAGPFDAGPAPTCIQVAEAGSRAYMSFSPPYPTPAGVVRARHPDHDLKRRRRQRHLKAAAAYV